MPTSRLTVESTGNFEPVYNSQLLIELTPLFLTICSFCSLFFCSLLFCSLHYSTLCFLATQNPNPLYFVDKMLFSIGLNLSLTATTTSPVSIIKGLVSFVLVPLMAPEPSYTFTPRALSLSTSSSSSSPSSSGSRKVSTRICSGLAYSSSTRRSEAFLATKKISSTDSDEATLEALQQSIVSELVSKNFPLLCSRSILISFLLSLLKGTLLHLLDNPLLSDLDHSYSATFLLRHHHHHFSSHRPWTKWKMDRIGIRTLLAAAASPFPNVLSSLCNDLLHEPSRTLTNFNDNLIPDSIIVLVPEIQKHLNLLPLCAFDD